MYDICIIGGGAAGMTAAICAKERNKKLNLVILEKKDKLGSKILASGNGRCNLTNVNCENYRQTLQFFQQIGVITRVDGEGRVYPYTEEARAVESALENRLSALEIETVTDFAVTDIQRDGCFAVHSSDRIVKSEKLLIACGGKAGSQFGTTGDGYRWARTLGHSVEKPVPALTAVDVKEDVRDLAGIRAKAKVALLCGGKECFEEEGEVQFTKTGLSGICVFNLSRFLMIPEGKSLKDGFDDYRIVIDFFPKGGDLEAFLQERRSVTGLCDEELLLSMVKKPIADRIMALSKGNIAETAKLLRNFEFCPKGVKGWDFAQVTRGGVSLEEINMETMESRFVKNLYFAGEVIDFDGPCGGYNLQNAWETGIKAGEDMANV